eukprot:9081244-Pyramimonas_sp.AAC.1
MRLVTGPDLHEGEEAPVGQPCHARHVRAAHPFGGPEDALTPSVHLGERRHGPGAAQSARGCGRSAVAARRLFYAAVYYDRPHRRRRCDHPLVVTATARKDSTDYEGSSAPKELLEGSRSAFAFGHITSHPITSHHIPSHPISSHPIPSHHITSDIASDIASSHAIA